MLKTITRLAIVAVAVTFWAGAGQAWGGLISWNGSSGAGQLIGNDILAEHSTPALSLNFDTNPALYGQAVYSVGSMGSTGDGIEVDSTLELTASYSSGLTLTVEHASGILGWGAEFLLTGYDVFSFTVGTDSLEITVQGTAGNFAWVGIETDPSATFSTLALQRKDISGLPTTNIVLKDPTFLYADTGGTVPEPTTLAMWSLFGLIGLVVARRRRK